MTNNLVIVAGGGIGGLATALTLHQIGVPCIVFEAVREMRPLGVGINLQPNAVREVYDLGFTQADLDRVGLPAKEWALVGLNGNDIYSEPRGLIAGYPGRNTPASWPFHMLLHDKLTERAGRDVVRLGHRVTGYRKNADGSVIALIERADGSTTEANGTLLMAPTASTRRCGRRCTRAAADPLGRRGDVARHDAGNRSAPALRPLALAPSPACGVLSDLTSRSETGLSMINWIAEVTMDNSEGWKQRGWFRQVETADFAHHFDGWVWDWLDVPDLIRHADSAFENPMIDRDPIPTWQDGPVALMGDAAHPMYPTGSDGGARRLSMRAFWGPA